MQWSIPHLDSSWKLCLWIHHTDRAHHSERSCTSVFEDVVFRKAFDGFMKKTTAVRNCWEHLFGTYESYLWDSSQKVQIQPKLGTIVLTDEWFLNLAQAWVRFQYQIDSNYSFNWRTETLSLMILQMKSFKFCFQPFLYFYMLGTHKLFTIWCSSN